MGIGVALAGGGLKGLAHIGALQALEELGVKIEYLSGTSSGSIFASFYAMVPALKPVLSIVFSFPQNDPPFACHRIRHTPFFLHI